MYMYIQLKLPNWKPVYIEQFFSPGTLPLKIKWRLPGYIEHHI